MSDAQHLTIVSAVFKLTNFVPLTAALHHSTMNRSFSQLSILVRASLIIIIVMIIHIVGYSV